MNHSGNKKFFNRASNDFDPLNPTIIATGWGRLPKYKNRQIIPRGAKLWDVGDFMNPVLAINRKNAIRKATF